MENIAASGGLIDVAITLERLFNLTSFITESRPTATPSRRPTPAPSANFLEIAFPSTGGVLSIGAPFNVSWVARGEFGQVSLFLYRGSSSSIVGTFGYGISARPSHFLVAGESTSSLVPDDQYTLQLVSLTTGDVAVSVTFSFFDAPSPIPSSAPSSPAPTPVPHDGGCKTGASGSVTCYVTDMEDTMVGDCSFGSDSCTVRAAIDECGTSACMIELTPGHTCAYTPVMIHQSNNYLNWVYCGH